MSIKHDSIKECKRFNHSFWKWLFDCYWSVSKAGEREWGVRIFGFVIDNEPKGGTA